MLHSTSLKIYVTFKQRTGHRADVVPFRFSGRRFLSFLSLLFKIPLYLEDILLNFPYLSPSLLAFSMSEQKHDNVRKS